ncbi:MAG: hypothetical protein ACK4Y4_03910 [Brevundimonas sp.]
MLQACLGVAALSAPVGATARDVQTGFHFRTGFWRNLHHALYADASGQPGSSTPWLALTPGDQAALDGQPPQALSAWTEARDIYGAQVSGRHLLFDARLRSMGHALSDAGEGADPPDEVPPGLRAALALAAPVYGAALWDRHQRNTRTWTAGLRGRLAEHEAALSARLVDVFEAPWPPAPIIVEVSAYGSAEGAYTTINPLRIAVAALDPANQEDAALEILMHETAHAMSGPLEAMLRDAGLAERRPQLWHQALFYLVGRITAERLTGYTPYADANNLWRRFWSPQDRARLAGPMDALLRGETTLAGAVQALAG